MTAPAEKTPRRRRRKRLPEAPVETVVESLSHDGRGVARVEGKTVFIHGALPGETVRFLYTAKRRHFDEGRVDTVLVPSPERIEPRCPHFGVCGGCSLQHLDPAAQIRAKQQTLLDNLGHLGGVAPEAVLEPLTGPLWGYRHQARVGVKHVPKKGKVLVGFRERGTPYVADLSRCEILHPAVGERIEALSALIDGLEARARIPQIEVAAGDDTVALVFRHLDPLSESDRAALAAFAAEHGFAVYLQPKGPDTVTPLAPAEPRLHYGLPAHAVTLDFLPTDFVQVNPAMNRSMVDRALALLELEPGHRVLDLFCGLGNFTLPLARRAAEVVGVEGDAALVQRARDNAARNGIGNATFFSADLTQDPAASPWLAGPYDRVLLDPPRSGAAEMIPRIAGLGVERIVYVSCHPASLARDAGLLVNEHGYRLAAAGVMDMFPHTAHVESIGVFERAGKKSG